MGFKTIFGNKGPVTSKTNGVDSEVIISGSLTVNNSNILNEITSLSSSIAAITGSGGTPAGYNSLTSSFNTLSSSFNTLSSSFNSLSSSFVPLSASFTSLSSSLSGTYTAISEIVWLVESSATGSSYVTSGITFIPLLKNSNDTITFQCTVPKTGTGKLNIIYGTSVAHSGNIQLRLDKLLVSTGSLDGTLVSGSAFTFTPGNDTNKKVLTQTSSSELQFSVSQFDVIRARLTRVSGASDTHTGDMRIIEIRAIYE